VDPKSTPARAINECDRRARTDIVTGILIGLKGAVVLSGRFKIVRSDQGV
jgi:hypothetical protein